jgi:hypothetical protein
MTYPLYRIYTTLDTGSSNLGYFYFLHDLDYTTIVVYLISSQSFTTRTLVHDIYLCLTLQEEVKASTLMEINTVIKASSRWTLRDDCLSPLINCEGDTLLKSDGIVSCVFVIDSNLLIEEVAIPGAGC